MKRMLFLGLACGLLAGGTGCGICGGWMYGPGGPRMLCDTQHCNTCYDSGAPCGGAACGEACGPVCGTPCGLGYGYHPGPLSCLLRLFHAGCCGSHGCGEIYWGDFHGDPPDCRDPCDRCGNFTGVHGGGCSEPHVDGYGDYGGGWQGPVGGCPTCGHQSTGTVSTGTVSTGTVSTGTVSTGTVSVANTKGQIAPSQRSTVRR